MTTVGIDDIHVIEHVPGPNIEQWIFQQCVSNASSVLNERNRVVA
jgi:hypothetical protein